MQHKGEEKMNTVEKVLKHLKELWRNRRAFREMERLNKEVSHIKPSDLKKRIGN